MSLIKAWLLEQERRRQEQELFDLLHLDYKVFSSLSPVNSLSKPYL